jgi:hypothetical protein
MKASKQGLWLAVMIAVVSAGFRQESFRMTRTNAGRTVRVDVEEAQREAELLKKLLMSRSLEIDHAGVPAFRMRRATLPGCKRKRIRLLKRRVPEVLVGKSVSWSEAGRVARQWGIRCAPTSVSFVSRDQIRLEEGE